MFATALAIKFDQKITSAFCQRSVSEATRRNYRQVMDEFFDFIGNAHPVSVTPDDIRRWRDALVQAGRRPATVALKLSVVRSFYEYLKVAGIVQLNPAAAKLVPPPALPEDKKGRALSPKEVRYLLAGPNQSTPEGARDYAIMLMLWRLSLRVAEVASLKVSSIYWAGKRWALQVKVKGGRERVIPLPNDIKAAADQYLRLDEGRRQLPTVRSDGPDAYLFQPMRNHRTLEYNKPLTTRMIRYIVKRWSEYAGLGHASPHDARRTFVTIALDQGRTYAEIQAAGGWRDPKTVMRYDRSKQNLERNAINYVTYDDE
ncbi:MAG TPA: tyrosine-type recombinase/integrase [Blastocatellia bacterium]|nr:tyrosine-type recombinase/integrase [Blastocatellia bacterium]